MGFLKSFDPARYICLIPFSLCQFWHSKSWKSDRKIGPNASNFTVQKYRFSVISGFSFWALFLKRKPRKSRNSYKKAMILKWENVVEMLFKWSQTQNHVAGCCLLRASDHTRFTNVSSFLIIYRLRIEKLSLLAKSKS